MMYPVCGNCIFWNHTKGRCEVSVDCYNRVVDGLEPSRFLHVRQVMKTEVNKRLKKMGLLVQAR